MCDVRSILQPNIGAARDDPGNISAQLAQQGQVEPHRTCWKMLWAQIHRCSGARRSH
jgi:hypothetical protein